MSVVGIETIIPLPDGECCLVDPFIESNQAERFFKSIRQAAIWHQPRVKIFGKTMLSPRLAAWHGDADAVYAYGGQVNQPLPWFPALREARDMVCDYTGARFNSVLINMYRDGDDAMGWHADNEAELAPGAAIASLSLGAARNFSMRHKRRTDLAPVNIMLRHGALLVMKGDTQRHWRHAVPRTKQAVRARINLTFRLIEATV